MRHLDEGRLQAWLDRPRSGLSADELREIEEHLATCPACARLLEEMEETTRRTEELLAVPEAASEPVPPFEAVEARAGQYRAARRRRAAWRRSAWAASVVLALGAGWMANELYRVQVEPAVPAAETLDAPPAEPSMDQAEAASPGAGASDEASARRAVEETTPPVQETPAAESESVVRSEPAADAGDVVAEAAAPPEPARAGDRMAQAAGVAAPSEPARVQGKVTDQGGRPLSAAQVFIPELDAGALTDEEGAFQIELPTLAGDTTARQVMLTAQLIGYAAENKELRLRGGERVSADFQLPQQSVALDELVVTGADEPLARAREEGVRRASFTPTLVTPEWRERSLADAEAEAGFRPLSVPDLPVVRVHTSRVGTRTLVRLVQELEGGGELELVQGRGGEPFALGAVPPGSVRTTLERDGVFVVATAPLSAQALDTLLAELR